MTDKSKEVEILIDKAARAEKSDDALRFSQAACQCSECDARAKQCGDDWRNEVGKCGGDKGPRPLSPLLS